MLGGAGGAVGGGGDVAAELAGGGLGVVGRLLGRAGRPVRFPSGGGARARDVIGQVGGLAGDLRLLALEPCHPALGQGLGGLFPFAHQGLGPPADIGLPVAEAAGLLGRQVRQGTVRTVEVGQLSALVGQVGLVGLELASLVGEVGGGLGVAGQLGLAGGGDVVDHVADLAGHAGLVPLPTAVGGGVGGAPVGQACLPGREVLQGLGQAGGVGHAVEFLQEVLGLGAGPVDVGVGAVGGLAALLGGVGEFDLAGLVLGGGDLPPQVVQFRDEAGEGAVGGPGGDPADRGLGAGQVLAQAVGPLGEALVECLVAADLPAEGLGVALGVGEFLDNLLEAPAESLLLGLNLLHGVGGGRPVDLDRNGSGEGPPRAAQRLRPAVGHAEAERELPCALQGQVRQGQAGAARGRPHGRVALAGLVARQGHRHAGVFAEVGGHEELGRLQPVVVGHRVADGQPVGRVEAEAALLRVENVDRRRRVGHGLQEVFGGGVRKAVRIAQGQGPPAPHPRFQGDRELAGRVAAGAGGDADGNRLGLPAVDAEPGRGHRLVQRGGHGDGGAGRGLDVARDVGACLGRQAGVGGVGVVGVDAFDERRGHDRDGVEPAEGVAGVDTVSEGGGGRRQGHREPRMAGLGRRQGRHVLGLLGAVGHLPPQAAPFDGRVGHRHADLQALALRQDGVAGPDGEHVGRDVGQVDEGRNGPRQEPRQDGREEAPEGGEDDQDASGGQEERAGPRQGHLGARPDAGGVAGGLAGQGGDQGLGAADLRDVVAGQQFDGAAEPLLEFGMPRLDGPGDARQRHGVGQGQDDEPDGDPHRGRRRHQRQRPPRRLREEGEAGVDGHDRQDGADGRRHDGRQPADQDDGPDAPDEPAEGLGDRVRHLAGLNGCVSVHIRLTPLSS